MILDHADFVSVHKDNYVKKFDLIRPLKKGGTLVLNSKWNTLEELEKELPNKLKRRIAKREAEFYNIDASTIA